VTISFPGINSWAIFNDPYGIEEWRRSIVPMGLSGMVVILFPGINSWAIFNHPHGIEKWRFVRING